MGGQTPLKDKTSKVSVTDGHFCYVKNGIILETTFINSAFNLITS